MSLQFTRALYLRLFGLTALIAVGAWWWQLPGLAGSHGIAPIADEMRELREAGYSAGSIPTLLWLADSDAMLHALCALATLAALALLLGFAPKPACALLWLSWLSLTTVGQPFLSFQWDMLLVEAAFFTFFFAPWRLKQTSEPSGIARFLLAWLSCKLTLASGIVKLASGDPSWRDLTALSYHWWSQPLPTWTSVYANALPLAVQQLMCALMFVGELAIPLLALGPRRARLISAGGTIALQAGLMALGNYSFYNLLTLVLAVPLLDDQALRRPSQPPPVPGRRSRWVPLQLALAALVVALGITSFARRFTGDVPLKTLTSFASRFDTINAYGAFAVMTKSRAEIILEGSADGLTWTTYEFPWKPGALDRRPQFVAPWQPRLDWQMWFAALGDCQSNPWVLSLQRQLLLDEPRVKALFDQPPPTPVKYLRTAKYEYRFAPLAEKDTWWTRTGGSAYCPPVALTEGGKLRVADELR